MKNFKDNPYVKNAFYGLRPASSGLITAAGLTIVVENLFRGNLSDGFSIGMINWIGLALGIVLWILTNKVEKTKKLHPIILIGISAIVGLVFSM